MPFFTHKTPWSSLVFRLVFSLKIRKNGDKVTPLLMSLEEPLESGCVKFLPHSFKEDLWILPRFPKPCERPIGVPQVSCKHIVPY